MTTRRYTTLLIAALAAAVSLGLSAEASALDYVLEDGDTLARLAERFYGDSSQWKRIAEANEGNLRFKAGDTIFIPEDGDPARPAAHVVEHSGEVTLTDPSGRSRVVADAGHPLLWQRTLTTGAGATATLKLSDGGVVTVDAGSRLTMLGVGDDGVVRLQMSRGRLIFAGTSSEDRLEVLTPGGLAALEGRQVRFAATRDGYRIITLEGEARFGSRVVHENQHADIHRAGRRASVTPIPSPVRVAWEVGDPDAPIEPAILALDEEPVPLRWDAIDHADVVEVAIQQIYPERREVFTGDVPAAERSIRLDGCGSGVYQVRVRGRSADGELGRWTRTRFAVVRGSTSTPLRRVDGAPTFTGLTELTLEMPPGVDVRYGHNGDPRWMAAGPILVAGEGLHDLTLAVTPSEMGEGATTFMGRRQLRVEPIHAVDVSMTPQAMPAGQSTTLVSVSVTLDEGAGRPFTRGGPLVNVGRRKCRARATELPGVYTCTLEVGRVRGLEALPVMVTGRGGHFTRVSTFDLSSDPTPVPAEALAADR